MTSTKQSHSALFTKAAAKRAVKALPVNPDKNILILLLKALGLLLRDPVGNADDVCVCVRFPQLLAEMQDIIVLFLDCMSNIAEVL